MSFPEREFTKGMSILIPIAVLLAAQVVATVAVQALLPRSNAWLVAEVLLTATLAVSLAWLAIVAWRSTRLRRADGTPRWLEGTSRNRADDPALRGVVVTARDVSDRRLEEVRLRTMSRALEQSPTSIVITDPNGTIEYVNPKFCQVTGYSAEEVIGKNPRILKSGRNPEETYRQLWRTILSGHEWRGELHNRRKDGELYWEFASISPVVDERGKLTHFVAVKEDITERKRTEAALRDSEELFEQVFMHAPVGIAVADTETRWLKVNRALCQMLGYSAEELIGKTFRDITHPADLEASVVRARALRTGAIVPYALEKRYLHKNGYLVWVQVHVAMVRDAAGAPLYYAATVLDISARKEAQEALEHWAKELAESNRVLKEERAARERAEMELQVAQKLDAIGQLATGIAHEINTPMQYVGDSGRFLVEAIPPLLEAFDGYAGLVGPSTDLTARRDELEAIARKLEKADGALIREEIPQALQRIVTGVQRVNTIVKAMKEFAQPGQERTPADLNQMLGNTLIIARNEYQQVANVVSELAVLPPVSCNVGEVNQVFLNVLVNAAQAIAEKTGGRGETGTITIRTRAEGDQAVVEIHDTGCGIPDSIRSKVFDPSFTTRPPGRGAGQGLAIARSIVVDRHGGTLRFTSRPGEGTCFTIRLPFAAPVGVLEEAA